MGSISKYARWIGCNALALLALSACGSKAKPAPSASAVVSTPPPPPPSSAPPPAVAPPPPAGKGVPALVELDKAKCSPASADVAQYLSRGEVSLAVVGTDIGLSWLVQQRDEAKIAFGAYDAQCKRVARDRTVAGSKEHAPTLFPGNGDWIVTWFDEDGLAYARPKKEPELHYDVGHLSSLRTIALDDIGIAQLSDGNLAATSPFATSGDQLTVLKFSPTGVNNPLIAGTTKSASKPHRPVIASDDKGYVVVWNEADGHVQSARFNADGTLAGHEDLVLGPGQRTDLGLFTTKAGFLLVWSEGAGATSVAAMALTSAGASASPPVLIGQGKWPRAVIAQDDSAFVAFVQADDKQKDPLVVAHLAASGPTSAVHVADNVKDPPSIALVGSRVAVLSTEPIPAMATKRAILRTFESACAP